MLNYIRDKMTTARLKARYQRRVQEQVLDLIEVTKPRAVAEDPGKWALLGDSKSPLDESERTDARSKARRLVVENPHARNILRLLEVYVVGPGFQLGHVSHDPSDSQKELTALADRLWKEFLDANHRHFSYREFSRRTWRDGECFLRTFPLAEWPPSVRFVDPETIDSTNEHPYSHGILTDPHDAETPIAYLRVDPLSRDLMEEIPATDIFHTRITVDSNQKRGLTIFAPILDYLSQFDRWLETELLARKLQASIVLWRKVHGSPARANALADAAQSNSLSDPTDPVRRERFRPGTILTTSQGTELEYLQPNTNFGDAVPLGRLMLLCTAAGAGLPEFMLTSDASNANFSSTMVAEGPAVKMFQSEQQFFATEFNQLWKWVMGEAVNHRLLPDNFFELIGTNWSTPQLVTRDRPRDRMADVHLVDARVLSRSEVARRDDVDPATMQREIEDELVRSKSRKDSAWPEAATKKG